MIFFNNKHPAAVQTQQKEEFPKWGQAKQITAEEAVPGNLPIGWYVWVQENHYYALKPNEANTGLTASSEFATKDQVQEWLGIPLPAELPNLVPANYISLDERIALARAKAEAHNASLKANNATSARSCQDRSHPQSSRSSKRHRRKEVHIRFTDKEFQRLQDRVAESCLPQSVFMRQAVLTGEIKADPHRDVLIREVQNLNSELRHLRGECGKLGGMLKMTIKPNEDQKALHPEDWDQLICSVHALFRVQKNIEKTIENLNGRFSNELQ